MPQWRCPNTFTVREKDLEHKVFNRWKCKSYPQHTGSSLCNYTVRAHVSPTSLLPCLDWLTGSGVLRRLINTVEQVKKKRSKVFTRCLGNGNVCLKSKHVCLDSLCYSGVSSSLFYRSRHLGRGELSCACGVTNIFVSFINQNCLKAKPNLRPCVRVLRAKEHYCYATKLELGLKGNQNT